jgi:hypothetical protein
MQCRTLGFAVLVGVVAGQAAALTFERVPPLEEIAARATLAFRGTVHSVEFAQAAASKDAQIPFTIVTFDVLEPYAGCARGQRLQILQMGGPTAKRPSVHLVIPGAPDFNAGEEVVVFSNDRQQPLFGAYYGDRGVLRVARDESGVRRVLSEKWRPLVRKEGALTVDGDRRCRPDRVARDRCAMSGPAGSEVLLDVPSLDALIQRVAAQEVPGKPAQVVSHDRSRFELVLGAFARQDVDEMQRVLRRED